jgi:hypothetical protein
VSYRGNQSWDEVFFRTLLFKIFNRIPTWRRLTEQLGELTWEQYDFTVYDGILQRQRQAPRTLCSGSRGSHCLGVLSCRAGVLSPVAGICYPSVEVWRVGDRDWDSHADRDRA